MKKLMSFMAILLMGVVMTFTSCNGCKGDQSKEVVSADYDGVVQDFTAGVDHIVAMHKQTMFNLIGGKSYEWRNLQVSFNDSIKQDNLDNLKVTEITDVFYYWDNGPWVQYITTNVKKGTFIPAKIHDVWIEDADMSESEIKFMPEDVISKLKEWNGIIPASKGMVLRLPLGPRRCNPQWVIGDMFDLIFVDAKTGDITNWNPAFPVPNVNGPLGEWP